jgi:hypothetical protein
MGLSRDRGARGERLPTGGVLEDVDDAKRAV